MGAWSLSHWEIPTLDALWSRPKELCKTPNARAPPQTNSAAFFLPPLEVVSEGPVGISPQAGAAWESREEMLSQHP